MKCAYLNCDKETANRSKYCSQNCRNKASKTKLVHPVCPCGAVVMITRNRFNELIARDGVIYCQDCRQRGAVYRNRTSRDENIRKCERSDCNEPARPKGRFCGDKCSKKADNYKATIAYCSLCETGKEVTHYNYRNNLKRNHGQYVCRECEKHEPERRAVHPGKELELHDPYPGLDALPRDTDFSLIAPLG